MRLKINLFSKDYIDIPFNYQYSLHSAIYNLIKKSSEEYSEFLHNRGFLLNNRFFKLFTFSKLMFQDAIFDKKFGFRKCQNFYLYFSTPIDKTLENFVLGIFNNNSFYLKVNKHRYLIEIVNVETLPEPQFLEEGIFSCLSPICVSRQIGEKKHYLDYMNVNERNEFILLMKNNLKHKYEILHDKSFSTEFKFELSFLTDYLIKRKGNIRKKVTFKFDKKSGKFSNIIGFEAPFKIIAPKELIKIGYECGFGENNSAGFGMVEIVKRNVDGK